MLRLCSFKNPQMEASIKILNSSNRHFSNSILFKFLTPKSPLIKSNHTLISPRTIQIKSCSCTHSSLPHFTLPSTLGFLQSITASHTSDSLNLPDPFARITSPSETKPFQWNFGLDGGNGRGIVEKSKEPIVTVVLLGWLGSKQKHLRRYAELYHSRGINSLTFVAPVKDMVSLYFGRRFQRRISSLVVEISSWLSEKEKDGRERFLMFHTFSNTGWLAYGAILDDLRGRPDLLEQIKGCVVDSGGDPNIDPKVWAAGFAAAFLKKRSSTAYPSVEAGENNALYSGINESKIGPKEPLLIEIVLLLLLEKLFSFLLNMPDLNQRLTKIISVLSVNQPPCPQLYLYSSDDKVIPYRSVESFIEEQKKMGRTVWSYNFESSPHVDHYRTYPTMYSSQLQSFLNTCLDTVKQI